MSNTLLPRQAVRQKEMIGLLALSTEENFGRNRTHIAMLACGLGDESPKEAIEKIIQSYLGVIAKNDPQKKGVIDQYLENFLSGEINAYDVVGAIKEAHPRLRSPKMTKLWTQLSICAALIKNPSGQLLTPDPTGERAAKEALFPKVTALEENCERPSKKGYYESRPHLKGVSNDNPNWEEILGNLPPGDAGLLRKLLEGDEKNIPKAEAARALLWPEETDSEKENRKLGHLLHHINKTNNSYKSRVAGALKRHGKLDSIVVEKPITDTDRQYIRNQELHFQRLAETIFGTPETKTKISQKMADMHDKLSRLHLAPAAAPLLEKLEDWIKANSTTEGPKETEALKRHAKRQGPEAYDNFLLENLFRSAPNEERLHAIKLAIARPSDVKLNVQIRDLVQNLDKKKYRKELEELAKTCPEVGMAMGPAIIVPSSPQLELLDSALENRDPDMKARYGDRGQTILHVLAWWRQPTTLRSGLEVAKRQGADINSPTESGHTPAYFLKTKEKGKILLEAGVRFNVSTGERTPLSSATDSATDFVAALMEEELKKITQKKASEINLEI